MDKFWLNWTELIFNISKIFSNCLQIAGYLLHFITIIIDITIWRQVGKKSSISLSSVRSMTQNLASALITRFVQFTQFSVDILSLNTFLIKSTFRWLTCINIQVTHVTILIELIMQWYRGNLRTKQPAFAAIKPII